MSERQALAFFLSCFWLGVWLMLGSPVVLWYGPPVNPGSVNAGVLVVEGDGGCFGFEVYGEPGAFGGCG